MRGWKKGYMTKVALTTQIRKVVGKAHKIDPGDILVNWLSKWQLTKFPTGLVQKTGKIRLRAPGFTTRTFFIFQSKDTHWEMR